MEWLDFGINNNQSFDFIVSQLGSGGQYEGWSLPTIDQVITLTEAIYNPFKLDSRVFIKVFSDERYNGDNWSVYNTGNIFDSTFEIIGYNTIEQVPWTNTDDWKLTKSVGIIGGTDGLSFFNVVNHYGLRATNIFTDGFEIDDRVDRTVSVSSLRNAVTSTMLVRTSTDVPEPSTLTIFALGMIGLASRRFKK